MANDLLKGSGGGGISPAVTAPDTRVWMYRAGEAQLFNSPDEIPEGEGWQDVPVEEAPKPTKKRAPKVEEEPSNGDSAATDDQGA